MGEPTDVEFQDARVKRGLEEACCVIADAVYETFTYGEHGLDKKYGIEHIVTLDTKPLSFMMIRVTLEPWIAPKFQDDDDLELGGEG